MAYGFMTRSYLRSSEARKMKLEQREATERYLAGPRNEYVVGPICTCRSFRLPHELGRHRLLRNEWDWRVREEVVTDVEVIDSKPNLVLDNR